MQIILINLHKYDASKCIKTTEKSSTTRAPNILCCSTFFISFITKTLLETSQVI